LRAILSADSGLRIRAQNTVNLSGTTARNVGTLSTASEIPFVRSKPTREKQYDEDDQDDAENTNAAVTVAVAVATEPATESASQEDDEEDDKYEPE